MERKQWTQRIRQRSNDRIVATMYDDLGRMDDNFIYSYNENGGLISFNKSEYYLEQNTNWLKTVKEA